MTPDEITHLLDITPSRVRVKGEKSSLGVIPKNGWFLGTQDEVDSKDVRAHVMDLIKRLDNCDEHLQKLKESGCELRFNCFWESASGNGGPILDHEIIKEIGKLPVDIDFDIWFSDTDEQT
jgi:hypothetical protein